MCFIKKTMGDVKAFFGQILTIPSLSTQSALFGFHEEINVHNLLINHLLLIYKLYIYRSRESKTLLFPALLTEYRRICALELQTEILFATSTHYSEKWGPIKHLLE